MTRRQTRLRVDARKELRKASRAAAEYAADRAKAVFLIREARAKARRNRASLAVVWDDLQATLRMIAAWAGGGYRRVPWRTLVAAIGAMIYLVNPFDAVPDFVPGLGYLDDAAVIGAVVAFIGRDIRSFIEWEKKSR